MAPGFCMMLRCWGRREFAGQRRSGLECHARILRDLRARIEQRDDESFSREAQSVHER